MGLLLLRLTPAVLKLTGLYLIYKGISDYVCNDEGPIDTESNDNTDSK